MPKFYDLSQRIQNHMPYFPGDPEPRLLPAEGALAPWKVTELHIGSHTGTHIDAACHYVPGARTIDQYPVERFVLPGMVIDLPACQDDAPNSADFLLGPLMKLPPAGAVLLRCGWDQYWGSERYFQHPYLEAATAKALAEAQVGLVGIDALNVDSTVQGTEHVHQTLLGRDILIVENLAGLGQLKANRVYQFSFLPLALTGLDGSPVRAIAWEA